MRRRDQGAKLPEQSRQKLFRRIARGEKFADAAKAIGLWAKSIQRLLDKMGGSTPSKQPRIAFSTVIGKAGSICRAIIPGQSVRCIAYRLGRAPSTISRQVSLVGGVQQH